MATTVRKYAAETTVPASRSLEQIKKTLSRWKSSQFAYVEDETRIAIQFILEIKPGEKRQIRYVLPLPSLESITVEVRRVASRYRRPIDEIAREKRDQEVARLWRALAAAITGKLVGVESGIETIEQAFYASIVLPTGSTLYEQTREGIESAYRMGSIPPSLNPRVIAAQISAGPV